MEVFILKVGKVTKKGIKSNDVAMLGGGGEGRKKIV